MTSKNKIHKSFIHNASDSQNTTKHFFLITPLEIFSVKSLHHMLVDEVYELIKLLL